MSFLLFRVQNFCMRQPTCLIAFPSLWVALLFPLIESVAVRESDTSLGGSRCVVEPVAALGQGCEAGES